MFQKIRTLVRRRGERGLYECRHCGAAVDGPAEECPDCGAAEIAHILL